MKFNYLTTKIPFLASLIILFSLASCGSYEYVGHDNDGIYGTENRNVEYQTEKETEVQVADNGNYYKNYFKEKSMDYESMTDNGEVFTDIDSYQGEYNEDTIDTLQYENAYAGWGQNNDDVTINIYNGGYNYWGYRPYYRSHWNYGWGYAGFYDPFYYGSWYSPYYYGYGYHHGYPYYGYSYGYYGNPYHNYNPYYSHGVYSRRNYAYNAGRRSSILNRNSSTLSRRSSSTLSRRNTTTTRSRSTTTPRSNNRITNPRSSTPRTTTQPSTRTPRTRTTTPRTSTPRVSTPRSNSSSRSSSSVSRSSSSRSSSSSSSSTSRGRRR